MPFYVFYFIGSVKIICTSRALPILFSDVPAHYFKVHYSSYFLFGCLFYIPRILLSLSYMVYCGACKVHMQEVRYSQ
jgi:hypothetical protein